MSVLRKIVDWNIQRRLETFDPISEFRMLEEELSEFYSGYSEGDENEMVDALCDMIVLATGALHKLGYNPDLAMEETVREINSRKGSFNEATGKWEKDKTQSKNSLYKACYDLAKR